ncbi:MAG TPA: DsrE family protein [Gammaproteobacteria bacterium]|nr:DsrE family protein [Gammaproteobacteria bacterium]
MNVKVLSIVETAYRATLEEQDDTVLWLHHSLKTAGADVQLLLEGSAVNYAVNAQDASGLTFGDERQTQPPRLAEDLERLIAAGVKVHLVKEDVEALGLDSAELLDGADRVSRADLAALIAKYDRVWYW